MAIDLETEELVPLTAEGAGQLFPGGKSYESLRRYRDVGFRGVKLDCVRQGWPWFTSKEAVLRFIAAMNDQAVSPDTPAKRAKKNAADKDELRKMGVM